MAPPPPRKLLAVIEAALLGPAPPSPAQRVELLHAVRDAARAFRALLLYPGPKASDRAQVEAKEVRLSDMPPITLDDTDVQTHGLDEQRDTERHLSGVSAQPKTCAQ